MSLIAHKPTSFTNGEAVYSAVTSPCIHSPAELRSEDGSIVLFTDLSSTHTTTRHTAGDQNLNRIEEEKNKYGGKHFSFSANYPHVRQ